MKETGCYTSEAALAASLTLQPLSLYGLLFCFFPSEPFPCEATARNLTAYKSKALRIGQLAAVVSKRLLVKIPKQVIRLHADIGSVQLPLYQTPKIFHGIGMHAASCVLYGMVHHGALIFRVKPVVAL